MCVCVCSRVGWKTFRFILQAFKNGPTDHSSHSPLTAQLLIMTRDLHCESKVFVFSPSLPLPAVPPLTPPFPPELFPSFHTTIFLQLHYCFQTCELLLRQQQNSTSICWHRSSSSAEQRFWLMRKRRLLNCAPPPPT